MAIEEKKKTHKIRNTFIMLLLIIVGTVLWSRFISTKGLIVKEYAIINSKIPASFEGLKIVHFSDLHYGLTVNDEDIKKLVEEINSYKPHIVIFTGDLIDKSINIQDTSKDKVAELLNQIDAEIIKLAVKGNHDYTDTIYEDIMNKTDFITLNNENKLIYYKEETPIQIIGLPSIIQDHLELESAFPQEENAFYKIVLAHEPDALIELGGYQIDLMLSGHSHGGQIRLPFIGAITKINGAKKYDDAYYKADSTELYISSGIGTSEIPFRFFNKPSFNVYRIYPS